ncbi:MULTISPECIES: PolC-type DNA polymerase III [Kosmotoga]|uniref:DNA polymerase III PolC-type n=1 Tax=Kosmotoga olearia (strain ATCC BAA-1733 / DSM 21960 / TBF 19.5.1) TaxID=521045 RepID=C5CGL7_KOSOT|nr:MULTISPECIES: PolC-type DNA polymerase III [Kosmotoga]ACR79599.1 DNA polymerase III, alpha subunit [Kosmotoga olearia TBF 19.5.1]MDI3523849.1 polymerase subunit alpha, Gram-positive type [Kosmotoga sp.]MDK2953133.1 polymerase subunit alpha, Gram-positive type [Kosmotoga sp.]
MKLRFKELNIPISRIVERILGFYPEYNCDSFYVLDAVVDLSKREMTLVFDDKLPEKIKRFLLERFVKVASAQLNIRVSLGFRPVSESLHHPDGVPLAGKEPSGVDDAEFDIDAFIKHTNGLASYLEQSDIKFDGEKIIIHVKNSFAEARIRSKKDDLRQAIKKTAGKNIPFEIIFEPIQNEAKPDIVPETPLILSPSSATSGESAQVLKPSKKESTVILGRRIRQAPQKICDVMGREKDVVVAGKVFGLDKWNGKVSVLTFNVTDFTDSIICKLIGAKAREVWNGINNGDELLVRGKLEYDDRIKEEVLMVRDLNQIELPKRKDNAEEKRVELHLHTKMSALDAIVDVNELFKTLKSWGHDAVALTDHGVVQSIPNFYFAAKKSGIKPIFGMEGYMVNDSEPIVREIEDKNLELMNSIYVVFDLETTGLDPSADEIIEIGAVKLKGTEVIGEFSSFVKPERNLSEKVTRITGISDRELEDAPSLSEVLPKFLEFCKDSVLVAHNATFDYRFVRNAVKQLYNEDWKLPYIDTLALSKSLLKSKSYSLDNVVKRLKLGDFEHHRASEDARITAEVFKKLLSMAKKRGIKKIAELENLRKHINISSLRPLHVTILAKNKTGLRNLYELVTLSHTKYFYKKPRIPKSILLEKREGLIIGSACISGELSKAYLSGANAAELEEIAKFFDFIEIMPLDVLDYNEAEAHITRENLKNMYREFYRIGKKLNIPVVMTGDVHFLEPEDAIYRAVLEAAQEYQNFDKQPSLYLRTTEEMLEAAKEIFEDEEIAYEVVVKNSRKIALMVENIAPIRGKLHPPIIEGADEQVRELTYKTAHEIYGDPLPEIVEKRLEKELRAIIGHGYAVLYLIAQKIVRKSNEDGYVVGSRGSVGSSLVATMLGITEVNPLPPHYVCPACKHSEFVLDGSVESGYDLKDKSCPECGALMQKNGQNIPFETFLGFEGDKVPDIDLNFSGEYQERAHAYLEKLFGKDHVFRAGTISTLAERTAYGFVKAYMERSKKQLRRAEIDRLASGIVGVRKTTGQHPGGLMIVPKDRDVHEFTPVQFPANDTKSRTMTTHFAYEVIHDDLVKIDALGHDDPTFIRMLKDITGVDPTTVPMDDKDTLSIFSSTKVLGINPRDLGTDVGTLGIPEFGTQFVRGMLRETRPKTFGELVRISGLSHGTDVWLNNARDWIVSKKATLSDVIACRDDIMNYLISKGIEPLKAFKIMEKVRKGKGITDEEVEMMQEAEVPEWFIESCRRIKYLFPKAHAVAYVSMGYRVAYFKVHYPLAFYSTYFTIKGDEFDVDLALGDVSGIRKEITNLKNNANKNVKERSKETLLEIVLEMRLRGYSFLPVDLEKSDARRFLIEGNALRIPFNRLKNLGYKVAISIIKEREKRPFSSVEDLLKRTSINKTHVEILRKYGAFKGLPEKEQITLF